MNLNNKKAFFVFMLSMAVCCAGVLNSMAVKKSTAVYMPLNNRIVVIDAGHGGWEPYSKIRKKGRFSIRKTTFIYWCFSVNKPLVLPGVDKIPW